MRIRILSEGNFEKVTPVEHCSIEMLASEPLVKKTKIQKKEKDSFLHFPTLLPTFSAMVQSTIDNDTILHKLGPFVREAAFHLMQLKAVPLPTDYTSYARTLCNHVPLLCNLPKSKDTSQEYVSHLSYSSIYI